MTEQEISDNKILVAKFMGYQLLTKKYESRTYNSSNEFYYELNEGEIVCDKNGNEVNFYNDEPLYSLEDIPFNTWDTLIPIVQKIKLDASSKLLLERGGISDSILPYIESVRPISKALLNLNIEELWNEIVIWVKWYNTNKNESK